MALANNQGLWWQSSFKNTKSPILKFQTLFFHFCWDRRIWRNLFSICSRIWLQYVACNTIFFFEHISGLQNSPVGGRKTFVFMWDGYLVIVVYHSSYYLLFPYWVVLNWWLTQLHSSVLPEIHHSMSVCVVLIILVKWIVQSGFGIPLPLPYERHLVGWFTIKPSLHPSLVERFLSSCVWSF